VLQRPNYEAHFLQPPVTFSILDPNILLTALFSITLSLFPSLNMTDQVSHAHKTALETTEQEGVAVTVLTGIREVLGSNPGRDTDYPDYGCSWFSSVPPAMLR
jgi:K+-sensing histidine kinase KdpD